MNDNIFADKEGKTLSDGEKDIQRKWGKQDLNLRPTDYESAALTTELLPHIEGNIVERS